MKKLSFILLFVFAFYFCANAQPLLVENFDYPAGDSIGAHGWVVFSGGATNVLTVISPGLTFSGYSQSGIGNCTRIHNNGQDDYKQFTADSIGTMYFAFMVKVDSALTGDYFFALLPNNSTSNYTARTYAKDSLGTIQFGISKSSASNGPIVYGTNGFAYGTTYLLVVKYKFNTGSTTDDEMSLFVFSSAPPTTEPTTPYAGPVTGTIADAPNIARIAVRQGSTASSPTLNIDGFMVTTAWPITASLVWTEQTSGLTNIALYSVSAVDDNTAWACGANGKVIKTTNSGLNWVNVSGNIPTTAALYNIFAWNSSIALVVTSPSTGGSVTIYKTSNGGTNWVSVYTRTSTAAFGDALWMTDANNAYYYGDPQSGNWDLLKSTNGGDNWIAWATVPTTAGGGWNNGMFVFGTNVWLGSNTAGAFAYSSNMGVNWTNQTTPTANQYITWFNSATNGLCGDVTLAQTTNGGTNWATIPSSVTTNVSGICGNGNEWWAVDQGATPTVYYSSNNGANWAVQYTTTGTLGVYYHMTRARTGTTIWGVRSLGGISRYGTPLTGIIGISSNIPENYSLSQNYPNPFNPVTKIKFEIPRTGMVSIKIYNILGKEITKLVNEVKTPGTYLVDFDASSLPSGVYFYKLESNGFSVSKKMMLIK